MCRFWVLSNTVALRKESVDRNPCFIIIDVKERVALRKESVDRNCDLEPIKNPEAVALRKESVDRNIFCSMMNTNIERSLSARRAWIEIHCSR